MAEKEQRKGAGAMLEAFEQQIVDELDIIATAQGETLAHVAIIAKSLARLADRFAPDEPAFSVTRPGFTKQCQRGHGMQPTDDYCQTCHAEDHPRVSRARRPTAA